MEPCDLSALEARRALESGTLTAEALTASCLERIEALEPSIQAWVSLRREEALADARALDRAGIHGLLGGLPFGVKDLAATRDLPTGCGSPIYAGTVLPYDAAVVSLTRRAGGIILGKSVTTEFATYEPGPTANPRDTARSPGGSSSGSAAAVAAGMVPLALGTQTAGSIIRPASFCGVAGFKPTFGVVEGAGLKVLSRSLDTVGVLARQVADCALWVEAVTGLPLREAAERAGAPARVGLCRSPAWSEAEPAMMAAFEMLPEILSAAGATVVELELPPLFRAAHEAHGRLMAFEAAQALAFEEELHGALLSPRLRAFLEEGRCQSWEAQAADRRCAADARTALPDLLREAGVEVLVAPGAAGVAPMRWDGTGTPVFNQLWTLLGTPCVAVPGLEDPMELPLGVQVIALPGEDARAIEAAAWLEALLART